MKIDHVLRSARFRLISTLFLIAVLTLIAITSQAVAQPSLPITAIAWSPDGEKIAGEDINGDLYVWNATDFNLLSQFHAQASAIYSITWSPDNSEIAVVDVYSGIVGIWEWQASSPKLLVRLQTTTAYPDHNHSVGLVDWSSKGVLASISNIEEGIDNLHLWKRDGDHFVDQSLNQQAVPYDLRWSPDGTRLAVGDLNSIYLFDDFSSVEVSPESIAPYSFSAIWNPEGNRIAAIRREGFVEIVTIPDGKIDQSFQENTFDIVGVAWSPDGKFLATRERSGTIKILARASGKLISSIELDIRGVPRTLLWSPFGGRIVVGNPESTESGQIQRTLPDRVSAVADNQLRVIVPMASLEWLGSIAPLCLAASDQPLPETLNLLAPEAMAALTPDKLPDFVAQVNALPLDAIPSACAADLIAVADVVAGAMSAQ